MLRSEPLVHFAILGLLLFALHAALSPAHVDPLVVDGARVRAAEAGLAQRLGRAPSAAEISAALQVELDDERLYREALALGLERDDPIVRRRLIQKLRFVHEDLAAAEAPDDAALAALRDEDPARYAVPERHALTQVLAARARHPDARAAAEALRERLLAGEGPSGLGDPCVHGQRFGPRPASAYAGMFGDDFAAALADMPQGTWTLAPSSFGWHVVRVDARAPRGLPDLATLRPRLRADWEARRRQAGADAAMSELRARMPAVLDDIPPALAAALAEAAP